MCVQCVHYVHKLDALDACQIQAVFLSPSLYLFLMKKQAFTPEDIMSVRRLLPQHTNVWPSKQSLAQQNALRSQLLYCRSLDQNQFRALTRLNMTTGVRPVYHPCQLTYAQAFFTFSAITDFCAQLSKEVILAYMLCMFPDAKEVTLAKEINPQTSRFHYHCLIKFNSYNVMDARYNVNFNKQFFPNWHLQPVYNYYMCRNYILKDSDYVQWNFQEPKPVYPTKVIRSLLQKSEMPTGNLAVRHEALGSPELQVEDILFYEAQHGTLESLAEAFEYVSEAYCFEMKKLNALKTIMLKLAKSRHQ